MRRDTVEHANSVANGLANDTTGIARSRRWDLCCIRSVLDTTPIACTSRSSPKDCSGWRNSHALPQWLPTRHHPVCICRENRSRQSIGFGRQAEHRQLGERESGLCPPRGGGFHCQRSATVSRSLPHLARIFGITRSWCGGRYRSGISAVTCSLRLCARRRPSTRDLADRNAYGDRWTRIADIRSARSRVLGRLRAHSLSEHVTADIPER